jgi:hypothetical protein
VLDTHSLHPPFSKLYSGQSNMALSVEMAFNSTVELAAIDAFGPFVRFLKVGGGGAATPQRDVTPAQPWQRVSAAGMGQSGFSGFRCARTRVLS